MKNIIFTLILLISFSLPCLAANMLQQQAEQEFFNNPENFKTYKIIASILLIWEDYRVSKADKTADTYYNELIENKKKYCTFQREENQINCKYTTLLLDSTRTIGEYGIFEDINATMKLYQSSKIIIDDKDFPKLDKKLRDLIISVF